MVFGNSGRGRHSGRGGRNGGHGSGRFGHGNNGSENIAKSSTDELKFVPFQDGKSSKMTHLTVEEHALNHTRKTHGNGDDIATFIETKQMSHVEGDKLKQKEMGAHRSTDSLEKTPQMEQLKVEHQEEHCSWKEQENICERNEVESGS